MVLFLCLLFNLFFPYVETFSLRAILCPFKYIHAETYKFAKSCLLSNKMLPKTLKKIPEYGFQIISSSMRLMIYFQKELATTCVNEKEISRVLFFIKYM